MKNLLMTVFTFLIIILVILLMAKGLSIGNMKILSIGQIIQENDNITAKIDEANDLNNVKYKKAKDDLKVSTTKLETSKNKYLDLASVSSDAEIQQANKQQSYSMEFLWSQVGNYATKEGVNIKLEINPKGNTTENTLNFTVVGSYIGIMNYVKDIENAKDLLFRIENFKLLSSEKEKNSDIDLQATFMVNNISIKQENISTNVEFDEDTRINQTTNQINSNTVNQN